jgi:hypothetical protein
MPRYFCDLESNGQVISDDEGVDLEGHDAARDEAIRTLTSITSIAVARDTDRQAFAAIVRDESGSLVFRILLTLEVIRPH